MKLLLTLATLLVSLATYADSVNLYAKFTSHRDYPEKLTNHYKITLNEMAQTKLKDGFRLYCYHNHDGRRVKLGIFAKKDSTLEVFSTDVRAWSESANFRTMKSLAKLYLAGIRSDEIFRFYGEERAFFYEYIPDSEYEKVEIFDDWYDAREFEDENGLFCYYS
jgi:hypothetical protein